MPAQAVNSAPSSKPHVGLLLVHGIGNQQPGDFLSQFTDGFRQLFGQDRVIEIDRQDPLDPKRQIHAAKITLDDRTIFLYEVHWADLISDDLARGSFNPAQLFVLAWLPWFNKDARLPGFESYSKWWVTWWTWRLVPMSPLFFLGYVGLQALPHVWRAWEAIEPTISRWDQASSSAARRAHRRRGGVRRRARPTPLLDLMWLEKRTWLDRLLDNYAGDVVNYVISAAHLPRLREDFAIAKSALSLLLKEEQNPSKRAELENKLVAENKRQDDLTTLADRVLSRFDRTAWIAVEEDQCAELQVLGHSLGSVVAYHAMSLPRRFPAGQENAPPNRLEHPPTKLTRFFTIGSPLEKFHFFWPGLVSAQGEHPAIRAMGREGRIALIKTDPSFEWDNFYSASDMISGALRHYQAWGGVTNERIPGLGGVFAAHVGYKANVQFFGTLSAALGAKPGTKTPSFVRRIAAWGWSAIQTMAFPLFVLAVLAIGAIVAAGMGVFAAGLVTGLVWIIAGWAVGWTASAIFFWTTAFFAFTMLAGILAFLPLWGRRVARVAVARHWRRLCRSLADPTTVPSLGSSRDVASRRADGTTEGALQVSHAKEL